MANSIQFSFTSAIKQNNRDFGKPNEDYFAISSSGKTFIILDGVTRNHAEYNGNDTSAALEVCRIFGSRILERCDEIEGSEDIKSTESALKKAIIYANDAICEFRSSKSAQEWGYYPAAVGIVACICDDTLCFAYVGDCMGVLYRDNARIVFAEKQTVHASKIMKLPKSRLYAEACNKRGGRYSYGVFNGDTDMEAFLKISHIKLERGDIVFLLSDGLSDFIMLEDLSKWASASAEEIIANSSVYDEPPYSSYADDKALIKIDIR